MKRLTPTLLLLASACTGLSQTHIYAGPQTPLVGTCDPPSQATLTSHGTQFVLAPGGGTLILKGPATGQSLNLQTTLPGADKKPYPIVFTGQIMQRLVSGTLTTPRCRYALTLNLTAD